jgi:hypothetical protein
MTGRTGNMADHTMNAPTIHLDAITGQVRWSPQLRVSTTPKKGMGQGQEAMYAYKQKAFKMEMSVYERRSLEKKILVGG